jgi:phenylalanyl-tRNA synthetase beta chain
VARTVRRALVQAGLHEAVSLSLVSPEWLAKTGFGSFVPQPVPLRNALSADMSVMRNTLVPGLLQATEFNQNHGASTIRLFEVGRVFHPATEGDSPVREPLQLAVVLAGPAGDGEWRPVSRTGDFYDAKGLAVGVLDALGVGADGGFEPLNSEGIPGLVPEGLFHPGKSAAILLDGKALGAVGELHPALLPGTGLRRAPQVLVLNLDPLVSREARPVRVQAVTEFPGITRDLALQVPVTVAASAVETAILRKGRPLLQAVHLFDVYEGKGVVEGTRSLAYSLSFAAPDRTLRDEEVQQAVETILAALEPLGVALRGSASA